ncbi:MAG: anthranilate phosphoribosyltransferase [Neisseria sp.]|nr:anthranilate phosphoribosyltransferase [Neisseria sp.]
MTTATTALTHLIERQDLAYQDMHDLMRQIMNGEVPPEQIAAIITALRMKGESVAEISAAASVMREFATKVAVQNPHNLVDIVGTGGDGAKTFNISTTAMFVAAAAGAKVAKHGGRSVSSSSGAADVMEKIGANLNLNAEQVGKSIDQIGIGFMFAPNHHNAMRHVAPVRRALGFRSIFNILGPLTNPANASNQVLGVFDEKLCFMLAQVLQQLGSEHVLVVHGSDGLDEITITGSSKIAELKQGQISEYSINPEQFGLPVYPNLDAIRVENSQESFAMMNAVLVGEQGAARDIVLLNAAACLYAGNIVATIADGILASQESIDSGKARQKQNEFIQFTQSFA